MKFKLLDNLVPIDTCFLIGTYMLKDSRYKNGDELVPTSKVFLGPSYLDVLLPIIKPKLEKSWGKNLIPTYSYARILYPGSDLEPHIDRPSCEYSVTVTIGHNYENGFSYPIYMEGKPVNIPVGWGATYKGCEVQHWRDPLIGTPENFWIQAFFHYVDANGPHADWAWDKMVY